MRESRLKKTPGPKMGLALLLRYGMTAWIAECREFAESERKQAKMEPSKDQDIPTSVISEAIGLLSTMTLDVVLGGHD